MASDRYLGVRSIMETPIMDERKWAKAPSIAADAFMVDLEDSVPPTLKDTARTRVAELLAQPEYFQHRPVIARPNHLSTPWGRDDLAALAEARAPWVAYPKCQSVEDLLEAQELLRARGGDPDLLAAIETARGVIEAPRIAALERVVAVGIGVGDLSVDMGVPLYGPGDELNPVLDAAKVQVVTAGLAFGRLTGDFVFVPDLRDLDAVRRGWERSHLLGFTTGFTFYPPHVAVINEVLGPSARDLEDADEVITAYEAALAQGDPAVTLPSGRTILVHDYEKAKRVRARFAAARHPSRTGSD